jgi:hypothetical protein
MGEQGHGYLPFDLFGIPNDWLSLDFKVVIVGERFIETVEQNVGDDVVLHEVIRGDQ